TRGHDVREYDPAGGAVADTAVGGARVSIGGQWVELTPGSSGLASIAITALAVDPATGDVWVGTENEGLSVYYAGDIPPTATPGGPTSTPRPPASPTTQAFATVAPSATQAPGRPTATPGGGVGPQPPAATATPKPPRDVPEPATALLMGAGLAGLAAWRRRRRGDGPGDVAGE
ncbi:MAG: PEP-CTERM sorting domain-containing protein, partial [Anaerolineae bacterium]